MSGKLRQTVAGCPPLLRLVGEAFMSGVAGAVSTLCVPVTLAMASAQEWRFRQLHIAELIRSGASPDADESDGTRQAALAAACERMAEEAKSDKGINQMADSACLFLLQAEKEAAFREAAAELLRQGTVLLWAAFEEFSRDLITTHLDASPQKAVDLLISQEGRRLFGIRALEFEALKQFGFDLSNCMGRVVTSFHDLSSLPAIKTVAGVVFPDYEAVRHALSSKDLWMLGQRRHLMVHNRGVVDQRYLDATGDYLPLGERITISPADVENYAVVIQDAADAMLQAASAESGGGT